MRRDVLAEELESSAGAWRASTKEGRPLRSLGLCLLGFLQRAAIKIQRWTLSFMGLALGEPSSCWLAIAHLFTATRLGFRDRMNGCVP